MRMSNLLRHRGPDSEGYVAFNNDIVATYGGTETPNTVYVSSFSFSPKQSIAQFDSSKVSLVLGHRLLAIQDLSPAGHQPTCYQDRYWIAFNGEVYNFIELRNELQQLGHCFKSNGDTEVILAAYAEWGVACLQRFNGMWGFAILDSQTKSLFLARDRFGVKPLYYWIAPDSSLAFSSEIKAFTAMSGWSATGNATRIHDFVMWRLQDHTDETMFDGVYQLAPGHYSLFQLDDLFASNLKPGKRITATQWYRLQPLPFEGSFEASTLQLQRLLTDSVALRLRADVPVGSCLSGGLDSSSIVCIASNLLTQSNAQHLQNVFSACAYESQFDERKFMDMIVEQTKVTPHFTYPSANQLLERLDEVSWYQDEPFGSTSVFAQWCVFELATQAGVKVMLDGQGADELFAGYHGYFGVYLAVLLQELRFKKFLKEWTAMHRLHAYSHFNLLMRTIFNLTPNLVSPLANIFNVDERSTRWFNLPTQASQNESRGRQYSPKKMNTVEEMSFAQMTATTLPCLLHWEDRSSMAHSIEARVPFLDYRLVEFVLGLPTHFKLEKAITKKVLRETMRGVLPEAIRARYDKMGFVTPEEIWIKKTHTNQFRQLFLRAIDGSQGLIRPQAIDVFDDIVRGKRPFNYLIWRIISLGIWKEKFSVSYR